MRRQFRVPMAVIAGALLGLIALLATLQYRWLGQISGAERERMTATLNTRATAFAQDVDRELTRAYLLFQLDALQPDRAPRRRVGARYDRWQATARFPRMIKDVYLVTARGRAERAGAPAALQRRHAVPRAGRVAGGSLAGSGRAHASVPPAAGTSSSGSGRRRRRPS